MGLFGGSSKVRTTVDVIAQNQIEVNPVNNITIDTSAQASAITAGVSAIENLILDVSGGLSRALGGAGGAFERGSVGLGSNLGFGLMAGAGLAAITWAIKK